ncbi:hypothetical protein WJX84_001596 [Apatococcus fuscideae]|uniref:Uncharacterized protein n=1 Tax=Apatococcus fuscideae TaxID=2026836 RepID=A0AAW1SN79_9CHLO
MSDSVQHTEDELVLRSTEAKLRHFLNSIGFAHDQLPEHTKRRLEIISSCAVALGLDSASPEALCTGITDLRCQGWDAHVAKAKLKQAQHHLQTRNGAMQEQLAALQVLRARLEAQQPSMAESRRDLQAHVSVLRMKHQQYRQQTEAAEEQLQAAGFRLELRHGTMQQQQEHLQSMQTALNTTRDRLKPFEHLPPDLQASKKLSLLAAGQFSIESATAASCKHVTGNRHAPGLKRNKPYSDQDRRDMTA